ncbi:MAG: chemotaxis protein CheX [Magnetococcales bacterium]|nr:chemotaxis protein CheX [Magnetococcales bacterium]
MNEEISDAIVESVQDIVNGLLAMEVSHGVRHAETSLEILESVEGLSVIQEISAVVGFTGALRGAILLQGSITTALQLVGALVGRPLESLNSESLELVGELADLIAGGMRSRLSSHGALSMTPPMVVVGSRYSLHNARIFCRSRHFFQVPGGSFIVECQYLKDSA